MERRMMEPHRAPRRWHSVLAVPRVEADVMVIDQVGVRANTCAQKRSPGHARLHVESKHSAIEPNRSVKVGHAQMHVTDPGADRRSARFGD